MPTITGWIAVADVSDGQTFTRYYSTLSIGGSISTTQGNRKYFYDVLHRADLAPTPPTASTVFNLLIGTDGVTTYTWVKYADNATGTSGFSDSSVGKSYIGFAFNKTTPTESTNPSDYTWSLVKGADGTNADIYKTIYLFQNGTSSPTVPASTAGFNTTTGIAVSTGSWTTNATVPPAGQSIYVASALLVQTEGTGSWANNGSWVSNPAASSGSNGDPGSDAPRFAELKLYTNPAILGTDPVPSAPSATITWSTGALSSITFGWSRTPPTQVATSGDVVYESTLVFIDTTAPFSSTTATGSTPTKGISFSGLVTFSGGDFAVDGSTLTSIDGGNITTGTITTDKLNIDEYLSLSGPESAFLAGRTSDSDFTDNGFFIGRTSTNGTSADGFQLSMTSLVDSSTTGPSGDLQDSTLQAVIHNDLEGLKIFEPITYNRVAMDPTDTNIVTTLDAANETVTLTKGFIWEVAIVGAGSGGSAGGYYYGSFTYGSAGSAGGSTTATLTGASGYSGTRTWTSAGGAAPAQISGGGYVSGNGARLLGGLPGQAGPFGAGGNGGIGALTRAGDDNAPLASSMTAPTSPTVPPSYGSGGGGGSQTGDKTSAQKGPTLYTPGGLAGQSKIVILDLRDATTDGVLTATSVGAAGAGGTISVSGVPQINGAAGGQGAVCAAEFFNLYEGHDVRDIIDTVTSERNKKENLQEINDPIDKVKALTGYTYNYRTGDKKKDIGLLVEDLELIFPELISSTQISKRVRYGPLVALLIEALKVQDTEIQSLNTTVQELINRVEVLENNP
ncbi:tail fiber domain-containing protein [bacterium]|nr:tail fiber domain-containing protein [bacterium]